MKNAMKNLKSWWIIMAMIITASTAAMAAVPSAPEDLELAEKGHSMPNMIFLKWEMPDNSPDFDGFNFYIAEGQSSNPADFAMIDTLGSLQDSMPNGQFEYFFHVLQDLEQGNYTVYITSYNADGESNPSNFLFCQVSGSHADSRIYFTNDYPENLRLTKNEAWTYDIDAESKDDITIKYEIGDAPQGMIIDENTGVISWTPAEGGSYQFLIYAYEDGNEVNRAPFWMDLYVYNCDTPPVVSGTALNKKGEPIKQGRVYLYSSVLDSAFGGNQFWGEIENGEFSFQADAGDYEVVVVANGYKPIYLPEDGNTEPISLECGVSVTFAFELTKGDWNKDYIRFTTYPEYSDRSARIGVEWSFDFEAEASDDDVELRFRLENEPEGMVVNELTGVVTWTPTESGYHTFNIVAYDVNDNAAEARMTTYIEVMTCAEPIIVSGTVNFEPENDGDELVPVEDGAIVYLFSVEEGDSLNGTKQYMAQVEDGHYSIQADAGTYILYFAGYNQFVDEFWEDASLIENAEEVTLECGNTYSFNALVEGYKIPETYIVSGQITDDATGDGIPYAFVQVLGTNDNRVAFTQYVTTDDNGYYEMELPDNFTYIFRASTYMRQNPHDTLNFEQYIPEYYDNTTDVTEATQITLTGNLDGIDFQLSKASDFDNSLSGTVVDKEGNVISPAYVIAFMVETNANNQDYLFWGFTSEVDAQGAFTYDGLMPGNYVLLAFPQDAETAPGYYVENDLATLNWKEATQITVTDNADITGKVIQLQDLKDIKGSGIISGRIGKKGKDGGMVKGQGEPISGALVFAINKDGQIVDYKRTGSMGDFRVDNLANGEYTILVDKVGYNQLSMWAEITDEQNEIDIETITMDAAPTSVEDKIFAEVNLYPNPVVTQLTVNLGTLTSDANISLVDVTGVTLYKGIVKSNENHKIDVEGLASGMYYLNVKIGEELTVLPVSIAK